MAIENEQFLNNSLNRFLLSTPLYSDFKGGLNKANNQAELKTNELFTANNIILNKDMGLYCRGGVEKLIQTEVPQQLTSTVNGLFHARFSKGDKLIACINYFVYAWHNSSWVLLTSGLNRQSCSNYSFAFYNDYLIVSDGVNKPFSVQFDGTNFIVSELSNAPICKFVTIYQSRVFFAGDNTNKLYFSNINDITTYPLENTISIGGGIDNSPITSILTFLGYIVIFKKNSIYYLSGSSAETFSISQISNSIGCLYDNCSCEAEGSIYFLGQNGIYRISSGLSIEYISQKIHPMFLNIRQSFLPKIIYNNYVKQVWCVVGYGSSDDYLVFVYDTLVNAFSTYTFYKDSNVNIFPLVVAKYYNSDGNIRIIGANDKDRYIRIYDSETYNVGDDGYDSYAELETKYLNLGDPLKYKSVVYYTVLGEGFSSSNNSFANANCFKYDALNKVNTFVSNILEPVRGATCQLYDNKIYVIGGYNGNFLNKIQIINLSNNEVTYGPNLPYSVAYACSVLYNGKIYIFGGYGNSSTLGSVLVYDIANNTVTQLPQSKNMPTPRYWATATLYGDNVYVIGGREGYTGSKKVEVFNLTSETWSSKPDLPYNRYLHSAILLNTNRIYLFGGFETDVRKNVSYYDLSNDTIVSLGDIIPQSTGMTEMAGIDFGGYGYLFGGYNFSDYLKTIYKFDPSNNTFTLETNMIYKNAFFDVCKDSNYIYQVGGIANEDAKIYFKFTNDFYSQTTQEQALVINNRQNIGSAISNSLYKFISVKFKILTGRTRAIVRAFTLDYFMWERRK